jgi:hypothetical protein
MPERKPFVEPEIVAGKEPESIQRSHLLMAMLGGSGGASDVADGVDGSDAADGSN